MSSRLDKRESRVGLPPGAVRAAHLQHVRVGPAPRGRQLLFCEPHRGHEVGHDRLVGRTYIVRSAVVVPGTPRGSGNCVAPMTVLNQNTFARGSNQVRPLLQIQLETNTTTRGETRKQ